MNRNWDHRLPQVHSRAVVAAPNGVNLPVDWNDSQTSPRGWHAGDRGPWNGARRSASGIVDFHRVLNARVAVETTNGVNLPIDSSGSQIPPRRGRLYSAVQELELAS